MAKFGVGQSVRRVEDDRLLRGHGQFLDDINIPAQAYAHFVRSSHAHATINAIDTAAASTAAGVLGVFTGAQYRAAGHGSMPCMIDIENKDGSNGAKPPHWPLAIDRVRHVGDPVAVVVAESPAQAKDAAERIEVDYEPLPAATATATAMDARTPLVWDDVPHNLAFHWHKGDEQATTNALAKAEHITRLDIVNNRVVANPMEPRGIVASRGADGRLTLHVSSQGTHAIRDPMCDDLLHIDRDKLRVITPDVGGGFGMKYFMYPEYPIVLWACIELERPVKWIAERQEGFVSDVQGRDHVVHAELATLRDGTFLGMKVTKIANMGGYLSQFAPAIPTDAGAPLLASCYDFPAIHVEVKGVFTHTVPVDAYRGAGRPEANYLVERLVDATARELGVDATELRRKNFITPAQMPYKTALGLTYDSGEFAKNMDDAMMLADWAGREARKTEARGRGVLRGVGMATYMEATPGIPGLNEAIVTIGGDDDVTVISGEMTNGQGQLTSFAQIVSEHLGVPFESVTVVQGDSDLIATGQGTGGSKAMAIGGVTMTIAADAAVEQGREIAAELLEAAAVDVEYSQGDYAIKGTDRRVGLFEVAKTAASRNGQGLRTRGEYDSSAANTFPNGCHVCEVEIDEETGAIEIVRFSIVDEFGRVINPLLLAGQVHGGSVQGLGQAMLEHTVYDDSGQLLSGSFMDYCLPRAGDVPSFAFATNEVPCANNPLGIKGCGEVGTIGAPPAFVNAVIDALSALGVSAIDMPVTAPNAWAAIKAAKAKARGRVAP